MMMAPRGAVIRFGNGLTGMRERLAEVGGELMVAAAPRGVELIARVPMESFDGRRTSHDGRAR